MKVQEVYILTMYQQRSSLINHWEGRIDPENIVLRLNYVPEGSLVFMTGINVGIYQRDYEGIYEIRTYTDIFHYMRRVREDEESMKKLTEAFETIRGILPVPMSGESKIVGSQVVTHYDPENLNLFESISKFIDYTGIT